MLIKFNPHKQGRIGKIGRKGNNSRQRNVLTTRFCSKNVLTFFTFWSII